VLSTHTAITLLTIVIETLGKFAEPNGILKDNPDRAGDCLKVFDVEW